MEFENKLMANLKGKKGKLLVTRISCSPNNVYIFSRVAKT